ncbi:hypothetical protein EMCG_07100 [[Emmonsia] crescens]|uniref:Uncharacterized protein n=1 Tax=[Emmonsia] crescens TaxID=73230 RepID=A0A0G2I987_9EURO|nr:hypothetical protein EMCG_07100 [Emmonsia crescens UAMH 3008]
MEKLAWVVAFCPRASDHHYPLAATDRQWPQWPGLAHGKRRAGNQRINTVGNTDTKLYPSMDTSGTSAIHIYITCHQHVT